MGFLKRILGVPDKFNVSAAWEGGELAAEKGLALMILATRYPKDIEVNREPMDFIKNRARYEAILEEVKGWKRTLRTSEYIRYGDWSGDMAVSPQGAIDLRFEYAIDGSSSNPYIIEVGMRPDKLHENTSNFYLSTIIGHIPGGSGDCRLHIGGYKTFSVWDWDPGEWPSNTLEPFLGRFPYK
jgi:hypothetical protein